VSFNLLKNLTFSQDNGCMPHITKIRHMRTKIRHVAVLYFQRGIPSIRSRREFIFRDTFFWKSRWAKWGRRPVVSTPRSVKQSNCKWEIRTIKKSCRCVLGKILFCIMIRSKYLQLVWLWNDLTQFFLGVDFLIVKLQVGITDDQEHLRPFSLASSVTYYN